MRLQSKQPTAITEKVVDVVAGRGRPGLDALQKRFEVIVIFFVDGPDRSRKKYDGWEWGGHKNRIIILTITATLIVDILNHNHHHHHHHRHHHQHRRHRHHLHRLKDHSLNWHIPVSIVLFQPSGLRFVLQVWGGRQPWICKFQRSLQRRPLLFIVYQKISISAKSQLCITDVHKLIA